MISWGNTRSVVPPGVGMNERRKGLLRVTRRSIYEATPQMTPRPNYKVSLQCGLVFR